MQDRFKFRIFDKKQKKIVTTSRHFNFGIVNGTVVSLESCPTVAGFYNKRIAKEYDDVILMQCTGIKDKNGKLIYEGDIIVIPNQYPFYDYKNEEDMKQDLNFTGGEIKGESVLNYIGIVEWIYLQWQYVYHCVNPKKRGISEGVNQGLNDFGFDETRNTCYEVIGNIYENTELLREGNNEES